jgi:Protein of unknown function (DUF4238)
MYPKPGKQTSRNHYIPASYSGLWCQGKEAVLRCVRKGSQNDYFTPSPTNIGVQSNLYTIVNPDRQESDALETSLANAIDGPGIVAIKYIINAVQQEDLSQIKEEHLIPLFRLASSLCHRHPDGISTGHRMFDLFMKRMGDSALTELRQMSNKTECHKSMMYLV